jgi:hypothetical protein
MNTDSISSFSAGLMTGAGLTILTIVGGFFVTTAVIDKTLREQEQSTVDSSHYLQRAQEILDADAED